jgi:iron(II)-dependent oxidoreductase
MGVAHTRGGDANPPRGVKVPTFELSRTEVTVAQYRLCMAAGKCGAPARPDGYNCNLGQPDREQHPINCVSWDQAQAFAAFAGGRLPSESEWEFAATSGGKDQPWPWGGGAIEPQHAVAALARTDADPQSTAPVCSKPAGNSAQGLCDLMGNVSEWVADGYGPYGEAPSDGSARADMPPPKASDGCEKCAKRSGRVHRGGSWASQRPFLLANSRDALLPDDPHNTLGFRVARSVK